MTVPAPGVAGRYGMRVRTPELPMAFTWGEFVRGAGFAWLAFQLVFPLSYPVVLIMIALRAPDPFEALAQAVSWWLLGIVFTFMYALPWSIGVLVLVGAPAAWMLGLALRRVRAIRVHLVAFTTLGLVVGGATMWFQDVLVQDAADPVPLELAIAGAIVTGASVAWGWRRTAKRALADDALLMQSANGGPNPPRLIESQE